MNALGLLFLGVVIGLSLAVVIFAAGAKKASDVSFIINTDPMKDPIMFEFHIPLSEVQKKKVLLCNVEFR